MSDASLAAPAYEAIPLPDPRSFSDAEMAERAAEFLEEMKTRHSIRDFAPTPVPRSVIEDCILAAGRAPSGANRQPWHFVAVGDPAMKKQIREAAEAEEKTFYDGKAGDDWLSALAPLGTDDEKPFLETAPWLIVIFAERYGVSAERKIVKNYYINESVGIATGMLITALHCAGLATLTHTPNPMRFLNDICGRPENEKPYMILVTGHAAKDATVPKHAKIKKPLEEIATFR
ncbi:nitroreductase family protein [Pelagibius litoralis]|uniref:Nitroreductase family protein n=1 Tax=Pelagibius litoralis TaxID=374515 RepID=A0A967KAF0_9PROT|nr:nitroreductase family protein [Pelagibius litoralis]NIA71608.1 nitroreductase family protein [Pelagibius litoralis]